MSRATRGGGHLCAPRAGVVARAAPRAPVVLSVKSPTPHFGARRGPVGIYADLGDLGRSRSIWADFSRSTSACHLPVPIPLELPTLSTSIPSTRTSDLGRRTSQSSPWRLLVPPRSGGQRSRPPRREIKNMQRTDVINAIAVGAEPYAKNGSFILGTLGAGGYVGRTLVGPGCGVRQQADSSRRGGSGWISARSTEGPRN